MIDTRNSLLESNVGSWLLSTLTALAEIARLPDNWDGYGSRSLQRAALRGAIGLLLQLAVEEPPEPQVRPVPGGGVQFDWQIATRELELEVLPDGSMQFLTVEGEQMNEGTISLEKYTEVRNLVRWLTEG